MGVILPVVEMELDGRSNGWTDMTADVHRPSGIDITPRGMAGDAPTDRVATTAVCSLAMLNTDGNSANAARLYSPGDANALSGFEEGIGLRVSLAVDADGWVESSWQSEDWVADTATVEPVFTGRIDSIDPEPGQHVATVTEVTALDYMDELAIHSLAAGDVQQGVNESDAIQTVMDAVGVAPFESLITGDGPDTFAIYGDLSRDEDSKPVDEIQRICQSVYGSFYMLGNGAPKYEPRNEKRAVAGSLLTSDIDITENDLKVGRRPEIQVKRRKRTNKVFTVLTPREVATSNEVVYQLTDGDTSFPPGETTVFTGPFTDATTGDGSRAGAIDLVTPVENTDYDFNSEPDGSGTDLSASVVVVAAYSGNAVQWSITNNAAVTVYPVTTGGAVLLQARGKTVTSKDAIYLEAEDATSIADIGEHAITVNLPYQSEIEAAQAIADWFKDTLADDEPRVVSVPLRLNKSDTTRAAEILQAEISDIFTMVETQTVLDGTEKFFINAIAWEINGDGSIWSTWTAAPADVGFEVEFGSESLTTGGVTGGGITDKSSKSVTFTDGHLICAWVTSKRGSSLNPSAPTVTGHGLSWTEERTYLFDNAGGDRRRLGLYATMGDGSTGVVNFDWAAEEQDAVSWSIGEFPTTGTTVANSIVQSVEGTANVSDVATYTLTLAAFTNAANRPAEGYALNASDTMTPDSGITVGYRSTRISMLTSTDPDNADTSRIANIPNESGNVGGIAVEIKKD